MLQNLKIKQKLDTSTRPIMKNIVTRGISGSIYVVIITVAILLSPYTYLLLFAAVTGACLWEFYGLLEKKEEAVIDKPMATFGGVYLFVSGFLWFSEDLPLKYIVLWFIIMLYLFIRELYTRDDKAVRTIAYTFFAQIYIALPFMFLSRLGFPRDTTGLVSYDPTLIMAFFALIWASDTGAYLVGSAFGKHRLFERISPKKSWEGFFGGLLLAVGIAIGIFFVFNTQLNLLQWIGFALTTVIFGTFGDLVESMIKRSLAIKDSGNIIPGHGGMLDRFDSSLLAAPAIVIYYLFMF
jgi:phosphatidate cytidylyltransferase